VKVLTEPLLHFMLIGAVIYGAYGIYGTTEVEAEVDDQRIIVSNDRIKGFIRFWKSRWYRDPTKQELDGLIDRYVRETVYYKEAIKMGLDKDDPITRRRMAQKLQFLTKDVVAAQQPEDDELKRYFLENKDRYKNPDLITFVHVFFDPDQRGNATLDDANGLLTELRSGGSDTSAAANKGDRFMLSNEYSQQTREDVRKMFGTGFADKIATLVPGQWHGPVLSGYGVHLVYISSFEVAPVRDFDQVADIVLSDWQANQSEKVEQALYENLKSRYEIVIEDPTSPAIDNN